MKRERLFNAITDIRENLILPAQKRRRRWLPLMAAAAVLVLTVTALVFPKGNTPTFLVVEAAYPEFPPAPHNEDYEDFQSFDEAYERWLKQYGHYNTFMSTQTTERLIPFFAATLPALLTGEGNRACSPLSLYMSLAMLAETGSGTTQAQLLDLLNVPDTQTLRTTAREVWEKNYSPHAPKLLLANSLWLNEDLKLHETTLQTLATDYFASSYQGKMGSKKMNDLLRDWVDEQTGGFLKDQTDGLSLTPNTALALVSTVYMNNNWAAPFSANNTRPGTFHALKGDIQCDFLNESYVDRPYYWGENFTATTKRLDDGYMTLLLPDEGHTVEELLQDQTTLAFLSGDPNAAECRTMDVSLSLPKFDIASETELSQAMQSIGITEIFKEEADFSPLSKTPVYVSSIQHGTRIAIDEKGCTAASYTKIDMETYDAPPENLEQIDFVADRPFLFTVCNREGALLFAGVVTNP